MSENKSTSGGIGFTSLLLLLFIGLKLGGVIDWDWVWVLSPFWIPLVLVVIVLAIYAVAYLIKGDGEDKPAPTKSKWQERLEQVQEAQRKAQDAKHN